MMTVLAIFFGLVALFGLYLVVQFIFLLLTGYVCPARVTEKTQNAMPIVKLRDHLKEQQEVQIAKADKPYLWLVAPREGDRLQVIYKPGKPIVRLLNYSSLFAGLLCLFPLGIILAFIFGQPALVSQILFVLTFIGIFGFIFFFLWFVQKYY